MAKEEIVDATGIGDTLVVANSVTAPTGGATFCSLVIPTAGVYRIRLTWRLAGTTETQTSNVKVKLNGANLETTLPSITGAEETEIIDRATLDGVNPVQLCATNAATAGAVYEGHIEAERVE